MTSQTNRSDGNCKHLNTFNSGTWTRTKSHPSRGSGGGSSSNPPPPANIGAWSMIFAFLVFSQIFCFIFCSLSSIKFKLIARNFSFLCEVNRTKQLLLMTIRIFPIYSLIWLHFSSTWSAPMMKSHSFATAFTLCLPVWKKKREVNIK